MAKDQRTYHYDSLTGFWGKPNITRELPLEEGPASGTFTFQHNRFGNRDGEVDVGTGDKNFICFGGSHTWGAYVEQDERYNDHLCRLSGRRFLNMGHPSFGVDQICLAITHRSQQFNPEGILVEQYPWAFHRVLNTYVNGYLKPYFYLTPLGELKCVPVSPLARFGAYRNLVGEYRSYKKEYLEVKNNIDLAEAYNSAFDPVFLLWKTAYYDYAYELYGKIARRISDYCKANEIKFLIFLTAHLQHFSDSESELIDYDLPSRKLEQVLEKNGVPYTNYSANLIREHSGGTSVIFADGHLNQHGHSKVAECISNELVIRKWL